MSGVTMKELKDETRSLDTSIFQELNSINVNDHTEAKNGLTYLSWAWAWGELKKKYPDAVYEIERFGEDKKPYLYDVDLGYMVFTRMTITGLTHEMWLPVMDGSNKAMKSYSYEYKVKNKNFKYAKLNEKDGKYYDRYGNAQEEYELKTVEPASMFDINKTIMRCLVKNISMFGLGLYIYAGEDLPEELKEEQPTQEKTINIQEEIKKRTSRLIDLGVDFASQGAIAFIDKHNNGKHDVTKMNDTEKMNYIRVLETMIKAKEKEGKK